MARRVSVGEVCETLCIAACGIGGRVQCVASWYEEVVETGQGKGR